MTSQVWKRDETKLKRDRRDQGRGEKQTEGYFRRNRKEEEGRVERERVREERGDRRIERRYALYTSS